jgi:hypothetical protein
MTNRAMTRLTNRRRQKEAHVAATSGERAHASGNINVKTYKPTTYDQPSEGPALVRIHVVEDFSGDIEGEGVAEFLQTTHRSLRRQQFAISRSKAGSASSPDVRGFDG